MSFTPLHLYMKKKKKEKATKQQQQQQQKNPPQKQDFSTSIAKTNKNVYLFISLLRFVSYEVCSIS